MKICTAMSDTYSYVVNEVDISEAEHPRTNKISHWNHWLCLFWDCFPFVFLIQYSHYAQVIWISEAYNSCGSWNFSRRRLTDCIQCFSDFLYIKTNFAGDIKHQISYVNTEIVVASILCCLYYFWIRIYFNFAKH